MKLHISNKISLIVKLGDIVMNASRLSVICALSFIISGVFATQSYAYDKVKFEASSSYKSQSVLLRANLFKPEGEGPFPAVVLMHGCGGWQTPVRKSLSDYADSLVENGFVVLNLDSFGPRRMTGGKVCASYAKLRDARKYRTEDAFDALTYLGSQTFVDMGNVFLMGQSNGGSVAVNVANTSRGQNGFKAIVAYYPWCGAFGNDEVALSSPLLVLGGAKDDWVPPQGCNKVVSKGEELRVQIYPQAAHSFDLKIMEQRFMGKLVGFNKKAAVDSKSKMIAFFKEHLIRTL